VGLTDVAFGIALLLASVGWPFPVDDEVLAVDCTPLFDVTLLVLLDCASVDVTVVLETWREPEDLLPLDEP
jgi:hypothetical protein